MTIESTSKVSSSRLYIPSVIREVFNIKDGDTIIWFVENNNIILRTQENNKGKNTERFKVAEKITDR